MLNFAVGPVQTCEVVRRIGAEQVPYFRTAEFSQKMIENEALIKKFTNAGENAKVLFITGSGTAAMEAAVMNLFTESDRVLIVNGGSFGQRFVDLCIIHHVPFSEIKLPFGQALTAQHLVAFENKGYTGFLVNTLETSTGVYYDLNLISDFCKKNSIFLVADAISSFLADPFDMQKLGVHAMITGSQKALAVPPGISIIVLSEEAVKQVKQNPTKSLYFDLKAALVDAQRGQTPFTPAVGILLQINARLQQIDRLGVEQEIERVAALAYDFRRRVKDLPLTIFTTSLSNAVTPLVPTSCPANDIFTILKDEYDIWVCPNGGDLATKVFRVGHIGDLTTYDNTRLLNALLDLKNRGLL